MTTYYSRSLKAAVLKPHLVHPISIWPTVQNSMLIFPIIFGVIWTTASMQCCCLSSSHSSNQIRVRMSEIEMDRQGSVYSPTFLMPQVLVQVFFCLHYDITSVCQIYKMSESFHSSCKFATKNASTTLLTNFI